MKYIDAGYAAGLGTLFVYSVLLFFRRYRLTRLSRRVAERPTLTDRP